MLTFLKRSNIIRNIESGPLLESFMVAAVSSLLAIRFFLHVTGYPQLGAGRFHIAHMLWGGFFMLAAIIILLAFLGRPIKSFAAIIGGIGFGAFIDELGKFITKNNDYFYQPTVAFIYIIFILLFLLFRKVEQKRILSREEKLMNVLDILKDGVMNDLDSTEKDSAQALLDSLPPQDAIAQELRSLLNTVTTVIPPPTLYTKAKEFLHDNFLVISEHHYFFLGIVGIIIFQSIFKITYNFTLAIEPMALVSIAILASLVVMSLVNARHQGITKLRMGFYLAFLLFLIIGFWNFVDNLKYNIVYFYEWGEILASSTSAVMVVYGTIKLRQRRLSGLRILERALLITIFIAQFFTFYRAQLSAIMGLALSILMLTAVQYLIRREQAEQNLANPH